MPAARRAHPQHYTKAATALENHDRVITAVEHLKEVKGLLHYFKDEGDLATNSKPAVVKGAASTLAKLKELISTGRLERLESLKQSPDVIPMLAFCKIWGVGPASAMELVSAGFRSIADLRARGVHRLSDQQKIGLRHYEDFQARIPRAEVAAVEAAVRAVVHDLRPGAVCMAVGSYRRWVVVEVVLVASAWQPWVHAYVFWEEGCILHWSVSCVCRGVRAQGQGRLRRH